MSALIRKLGLYRESSDMANQGTIEVFGQSTNGKPKVKIDGQWYFLGKTDMSSVNVGDRISFESKAFGERGDLWGINKYAKLPSAPNGVHAEPAQPPVQPRATHNPPNGMTEGERLCVSNWVGQLCASGTIKSPDEIDIWVKASLAAVRGERQPGEDDGI